MEILQKDSNPIRSLSRAGSRKFLFTKPLFKLSLDTEQLFRLKFFFPNFKLDGVRYMLSCHDTTCVLRLFVDGMERRRAEGKFKSTQLIACNNFLSKIPFSWVNRSERSIMTENDAHYLPIPLAYASIGISRVLLKMTFFAGNVSCQRD